MVGIWRGGLTVARRASCCINRLYRVSVHTHTHTHTSHCMSVRHVCVCASGWLTPPLRILIKSASVRGFSSQRIGKRPYTHTHIDPRGSQSPPLSLCVAACLQLWHDVCGLGLREGARRHEQHVVRLHTHRERKVVCVRIALCVCVRLATRSLPILVLTVVPSISVSSSFYTHTHTHTHTQSHVILSIS